MMNKRIKKKHLLNGLDKVERYKLTHCPICNEKIDPLNKYFMSFGFCSIDCGYECYGLSRR